MDRRWMSWVAIAIAGVALMGSQLTDRAVAQTAAGGERFVCRSFPYDPHKTPELDTRDPGSEVGRWVLEREDRGWHVTSVHPEVIVKATGATEAWAHVCVVPVR